MEIEVKKIKFHPGHDDSHSYTAEILINGQRAFSAFNDGWGGPDGYRPLPGYTGPSEQEINAWLAKNRPLEGEFKDLPNSLEIVVGDALNEAALEKERKKERSKYERMLKTQICGIKDGGFLLWPKKFALTGRNIQSLLASKHGEGVTILNNADAETKEQGFKAYCPDLA